MKTLTINDFISAQDNERNDDDVLVAFQHAHLSKRFNKKMSRIFKNKLNEKSNVNKTKY